MQNIIIPQDSCFGFLKDYIKRVHYHVKKHSTSLVVREMPFTFPEEGKGADKGTKYHCIPLRMLK